MYLAAQDGILLSPETESTQQQDYNCRHYTDSGQGNPQHVIPKDLVGAFGMLEPKELSNDNGKERESQRCPEISKESAFKC